MTTAIVLLLSAAAAYLLGCLNGAILISRAIFREDIRKKGSGNAGLTNFYRIYGVKGVLGVIAIVPLTPVLQAPVLQPAFEQILPALFGGLGVVFVSKNWKLALAPIILMLILFIFVPALNSGTVGIMVPVAAVLTIVVGRIMYKKGML